MRIWILLASICSALVATQACSASSKPDDDTAASSGAGGQGGGGATGGAGGASCPSETKCAMSADCPQGSLCNTSLPEPACQASCGDVGSACSEDALCKAGMACLQSKCAVFPECCVAACDALQVCG